MTCTACWESSYKHELALPNLQAGKRLPVAVPEGVPSPKHTVSPPVAGNTYFLLQHWEDSDQDQRVKHLLLLSIIQFFLADNRLLLIPSECVRRMWCFHGGTHEPSHKSSKMAWQQVTGSLLLLTLSSTGDVQHAFKVAWYGSGTFKALRNSFTHSMGSCFGKWSCLWDKQPLWR